MIFQRLYEGMMIAVDKEDWDVFYQADLAYMAFLLIHLAKQVNLKKFKKHKRSAKKPKAKQKWDKNKPHVSTFKVISEKITLKGLLLYALTIFFTV